MPSLNQMILMLRNNLKGLSRIEEHDLSINCKAIRDSAISKYVIRNRIHQCWTTWSKWISSKFHRSWYHQILDISTSLVDCHSKISVITPRMRHAKALATTHLWDSQCSSSPLLSSSLICGRSFRAAKRTKFDELESSLFSHLQFWIVLTWKTMMYIFGEKRQKSVT